MEHIENLDHLKFQRILNTIFGVALYTYSFGPKVEFLKHVYQFLGQIIIVLVTIIQILAIPHVTEDINIICGCLSATTHCFQLAAKTTLLIVQRNRYISHLKKAHELQEETNALENRIYPDHTAFGVSYKQQSRYLNIILAIQITANIIFTSTFFLPSVYDSIVNSHELRRQTLPIVVYIGMDFTFTPLYQIIAIIVTIGFYIANVKTVVVDSFILNVIIFHMSQVKYHNNLLNKIMVDYDAGVDLPYKKIITIWIEQHQKYLRLYENFKKLISPYLIFEFGFVVVHTCIPAFVITSTYFWNGVQKITVFCVIQTALNIMFLMCLAGEVFSAEWGEARNILFNDKLVFKEGKWLRHCYSFIQLRLQKRFRFSAFTVIALNCSTFIKISKFIFSCYTTLIELQKLKEVD